MTNDPPELPDAAAQIAALVGPEPDTDHRAISLDVWRYRRAIFYLPDPQPERN